MGSRLLEQGQPRPPEAEEGARDVELEAVVRRVGHQTGRRCRAPFGGQHGIQLLEQRAAPRVVDRPPVIGIDEPEVPDLGALIEIGYPRRADLDRVDGFDADYSGWGKEDSDIIVRLPDGSLAAHIRALPGRRLIRLVVSSSTRI